MRIAGQPSSAHRLRQILRRFHGAERRQRETGSGEKRFFAQAVLGGVQHRAGRTHRSMLGRGLRGGRRNIFKLECDHADARGEAPHRVQIVVGGLDFEVGHLARGRVFVRRKRVHAVAHAPRRDGEHAAQLAAAQHADSGAGKNRLEHFQVKRVAQHAIGLRRAPRAQLGAQTPAGCAARIDTANRAALVAPALPMANVATGTPPGICTIDSSESMPFSACDLHRHSQHRQRRVRGHHSGQMRRAARARDDRLQPALFRRRGVLRHQPRRAVRGNDLLFVRNAEAFQNLGRVAHGVPVGLAAHDQADEPPRGFGSIELLLTLREREAGFAVVVAQVHGHGDVQAESGHALQQRHDLLLCRLLPGSRAQKAAAETVGAEGLRRAFGPHLDAAVGDHLQLQSVA